jgi:hypothetical protein
MQLLKRRRWMRHVHISEKGQVESCAWGTWGRPRVREPGLDLGDEAEVMPSIVCGVCEETPQTRCVPTLVGEAPTGRPGRDKDHGGLAWWRRQINTGTCPLSSSPTKTFPDISLVRIAFCGCLLVVRLQCKYAMPTWTVGDTDAQSSIRKTERERSGISFFLWHAYTSFFQISIVPVHCYGQKKSDKNTYSAWFFIPNI